MHDQKKNGLLLYSSSRGEEEQVENNSNDERITIIKVVGWRQYNTPVRIQMKYQGHPTRKRDDIPYTTIYHRRRFEIVV